MYEEQTSSFKTAISFIKWFSIYITNLAKIKARKAGTIPRDSPNYFLQFQIEKY